MKGHHQCGRVFALKTVLEAAVKHESTDARAGTFEEYLQASNLPPSLSKHVKFSSAALHNMSETNTLSTIWRDDVGEAGNFSELQGRGGIITFDWPRRQGFKSQSIGVFPQAAESVVYTAIIGTSPDDCYFLPHPYLKALPDKSQLPFVPPSGLAAPPVQAQGSSKRPTATPLASQSRPTGNPSFFIDDGHQCGLETSSPNITNDLGTTSKTGCERWMDAARDLREIMRQRGIKA